MPNARQYWEKVRTPDHPLTVQEMLPRGYVMDANGTYTFNLGDEMLGMAVIYNNRVSIQSLNRTQSAHGDLFFIGREGNYLVYHECLNGEVQRLGSETEASRKISTLQLVVRENQGRIELLDIGSEKIRVSGRFLA